RRRGRRRRRRRGGRRGDREASPERAQGLVGGGADAVLVQRQRDAHVVWVGARKGATRRERADQIQADRLSAAPRRTGRAENLRCKGVRPNGNRRAAHEVTQGGCERKCPKPTRGEA